ncbi:MAG TPA: triose-phosphate isomerase [Flavobacteriales bacterium]|jgi:triosephosphate isomerase|nr:triose-phosphate isomerase [Flavobacteriales bacterium]HIO59198.1 triose-phosphate isomerase [Flavobacteriales bacterium]
MMRNIVAGNWKSNKSINDARDWVSVMDKDMESLPIDVKVMIAPPAPYLASLVSLSNSRLLFVSQQVSATQSGAYTGEFTAEMLVSCGVDYALIGHSERRASYGETDEVVCKKVRCSLDAGLGVVLCCGENLDKRDAGEQEQVIKDQLSSALDGVNALEMEDVIIAYEPIWAIGTGRTASAEQAASMHGFIREWLASRFDLNTASATSILYGGSCKPSNANEIFASEDVDGGLIGGASLNPEEFQEIIKAASSL